MNQQIVNYLNQYKDQYPQDQLVGQLRDAGYLESEIQESVKAVYGEKSQEQNGDEAGKKLSYSAGKGMIEIDGVGKNSEFESQIKNMLAQGVSREQIYQEFIAKGWSIDQIGAAISGKLDTRTEDQKKSDHQAKTAKTVLAVGAIFVGAGIFSFIAANWSSMSDIFRVMLIIGAMMAAYFSGWFLRENTQYSSTGTALIFLGNIIYGAGIFLIAQIFNIQASWPDGMVLWMLGVTAVAYALRDVRFYVMALVIGFIAAAGYPFLILFEELWEDTFILTPISLLLVATIASFWINNLFRSGAYKDIIEKEENKDSVVPDKNSAKSFSIIFFIILLIIFAPAALGYVIYYIVANKKGNDLQLGGQLEEFFALLSVWFFGAMVASFLSGIGFIESPISISVFITIILSMCMAYYFRYNIILTFGLLAFLGWMLERTIRWIGEYDINGMVIILSGVITLTIYYLIGRIHKESILAFYRTYRTISLFFMGVLLFFLSTKIGLHFIESMSEGEMFFASWQAAILIFAIIGAYFLLVSYIFSKRADLVKEGAASVIPIIFFGILSLIPDLDLFTSASRYYGGGSEMTFAGIVLALILNIFIFVVLLGIIYYGYINRDEKAVSTGTVLMFILMAVKYFDWFYSFMDRSIFFISAGIVMLGMGFLMEYGRKSLIQSMKN